MPFRPGDAPARAPQHRARPVRAWRRAVVPALCLLLVALPAAAAEPALRLGILKYGTLAWELDAMRQHGLDRAQGIEVEAVELAGTPATQVALQAGRVDMILSDWLWVSRQRGDGADWSFVPYSTALGALVVPPGSPLRSLADLRGRRIGVAGSPVDKSWLILRLLARREHGLDLAREAEASFAAPPLLDAQLQAGRLDAVLTYWPFAAKLEAAGMTPLLEMRDALHRLGFTAAIPMVGYVVSDAWAAQHRDALERFWRAARAAREVLATDDAEWTRLAPLTGARDAAELVPLRDAYRAGIPLHWGDAERADAARLYRLLAEIGGPALVGEGRELAPGTFLDWVRY